MQISSKFELFAEQRGLRLRAVQAKASDWDDTSVDQFVACIASLKADGIFESEGADLVATLESLLVLEGRELDPLSFLFEWSPMTLKIEGKGALGFDDFEFVARFYHGKRVVQPRTLGVVAWRNQTVYRLPASQAIAIALIESFNTLTGGSKTKAMALDLLYRLKVLGESDQTIQFDNYLKSEHVVRPAAVGLNAQDDGHRAIVYPVVNGVSEEALKKQFLNISEVQDVYDIDPGDGQSRQRLVISPELKEVLESIKKSGFGVSGSAREAFYRNPRSLLPEGESQNPDLIEVIGFGPRVKGIGYASFARPITSSTKENWFGEKLPSDGNSESPKRVSIECAFVDGETKVINFENEEVAENFHSTISAALAEGRHSVEWEDVNIPISDSFVASFAEQFASSKRESGTASPKADSKSKRLLIHTNEEEVDYSEATSTISSSFKLSLPKSLRQDVVLKEHQKAGITWLSGLLNRDLAKGALLADDMGLGKTLQILTFLAWCIESELEELGKDQGPYDPILVVAPLILLENWDKEINRYFEPGVFSPLEKLHGSVLKKYRKDGSTGKESEPGVETLDIAKLKNNRIIVTNFETVKNYQYTFAKIPWSVVVVDEAQEIKEPSTAVTYALKVLNPTFRVASTGTPVETSLSNLWSIMDFAQPGNALGSLRSFNKEFAKFKYDDPELGAKLRSAIGFNSETGLVLRRAKKDVLKDLPPKSVLEHSCEMDAATEQKYQAVIDVVRNAPKGSMAALQGLHQISQISQHPFLIEGEPFRSDHREYVAASSKLQKLLSLLTEIKEKSEKALVFTRSRKMQDMLKAVLDAEFQLDVGIVNGTTASKHKYVANTREGIIDRFSEGSRFDVLILSPEVAGVGLTITAANHVVHYGRWWNPAKENQATDRAYRIGQTRPVFVHHLLLKHPTDALETFDQKLHRLLKAREELADNFLAPTGDESAIQEELLGNIFDCPASKNPVANSGAEKPALERLSPFEFECATALLFQQRCKDVFVTSRTGDRGIDVVGFSKNEVVLVQCKKFGANSILSSEVIGELIDGADYYREFVIPKALKHLPIKLVLVTTAKTDRALLNSAKAHSIEVVDGPTIRKMYGAKSINSALLNNFDVDRPKNIDALAKMFAKKYSAGF